MRRLVTTAVVCSSVFAISAGTAAGASPQAQPAPMPQPLPSISLPILDGVSLDVDAVVAEPGGLVDAAVVNHSDDTVSYGLRYAVDRWTGGEWEATGLAPDVVPQVLLLLAPGERGAPQTIDLPAEVPAGLYRVTKRIQHEDTGETATVRDVFVVGPIGLLG